MPRMMEVPVVARVPFDTKARFAVGKALAFVGWESAMLRVVRRARMVIRVGRQKPQSIWFDIESEET